MPFDEEIDVELTYDPLPKQMEFHDAPDKYRCFLGGFGSGKSYALCAEAIQLGLEEPFNQILVARKTYTELEDTTWPIFLEMFPDELIYDYLKKRKCLIARNGTMFLGRSLDNPKKYASLNLGAFAIDEADEATEKDFLTLCGRLRRGGITRHCGIMSSNPPPVDHWLYRYFVEKGAKFGYRLIKSSSRDNPYLPPDYVDNLEREYPASWVKRYVDGEFGFVLNGDPVYGETKEAIHFRTLLYDPHKPVIRGWDFGWHHPFVAFAQFDENGIYFLAERMGKNIYLNDFAKQMLLFSNEKFPGARFIDYCDPHGNDRKDSGQSSVEILQSNGIYPSFRRTEVNHGIELTNRLMKTLNKAGLPMLQVDLSCRIIKEMFLGGYCYGKVEGKTDGKGAEPVKDGYYEHAADASRYIIVNIFSNSDDTRRKYSAMNIPQVTY